MEAINVLKFYKVLDNNLKFYKHKLVSENDFNFLVNNLHGVMKNADKYARVLAYADDCCAYRINNEIYFIPATIKGVYNNGDDKLNFVFDYPCEMKREDLTEIL